MDKEFEIGEKIRYVGKGFDNFDAAHPFATFLGYDSHGWKDLWIDYRGTKMQVKSVDVERAGNEESELV